MDAGEKGGLKSAPTQIAATQSEERSIPVRVALFALRFYKTYLSILFAGSCRFEPTCSRFAYEAIERFGMARGVWLGLKRLLRCHPLSRKFGYDPVPEKWEEMPTSSAVTKVLKTEAHS
jgi:putative membrane protein insertion efficiency factor